ncbi:hypothetical protein D3C74_440860 [compost metagenome]
MPNKVREKHSFCSTDTVAVHRIGMRSYLNWHAAIAVSYLICVDTGKQMHLLAATRLNRWAMMYCSCWMSWK